MPDFTKFTHPVLAIACPECGAQPGQSCIGLQPGRTTGDFHLARKTQTGTMFADQHGPDAEISKVAGRWVISSSQVVRATQLH